MNIGELANGGGHGRGNPPARRRPAAGGTRTLFGLGQQAGITGGKKYAIFSGFLCYQLDAGLLSGYGISLAPGRDMFAAPVRRRRRRVGWPSGPRR